MVSLELRFGHGLEVETTELVEVARAVSGKRCNRCGQQTRGLSARTLAMKPAAAWPLQRRLRWSASVTGTRLKMENEQRQQRAWRGDNIALLLPRLSTLQRPACRGAASVTL